jgi:6-phosphogluconolactonase (cycloisomerase 2 family)
MPGGGGAPAAASRISRRTLVHLAAAGAFATALSGRKSIAQDRGKSGDRSMSEGTASFVYVGARTTRERNARGNGLNVYRMDNATGGWTHIQLLADLVNPSFLAFDRTRRFLYTVHGDLSDITAMSIDKQTGMLRVINRQGTQGKNPVHLAIDPTNRHVVVANHITSTLAVLPRREDGSLGEITDLVKLEGKLGPHRVEQPFAKPHQVEFDPSGRFLIVPDKGLDQVFTYSLDAEKGKLQLVSSATAREGAGPRHVAFDASGRFAYVINELDSTVTAYRFDAASGALAPFQVISALPDSFTGNSRASEIAVTADGRFVYASNRGYDSVAVLARDLATGRLTTIACPPSGGKTPRFFAIDPAQRFVYVANEDSDTIRMFRIEGDKGTLAATDIMVQVGSPVCIVFGEHA